MPEKTICILGGTGFVGTRLVTRLAGDGHTVRVPTRYREGGRHLLVLPSVSLLQADPHDEAQLATLLQGCDVVINLVGILNEKGRSGAGFRHAHTELTRKVVAAARANGVSRLLQMSALKANAERGPSHYLRSKGEAELIVRNDSGPELAWTIFQPSVIFGPGDSFLNRFAGLLRLMPVLPLACPDARFAPVYIEDVVEAMARAITDVGTHGQTLQLCGPTVYSLRELVRFVAQTLGLRRAIIGLPDWASRLQAVLMDFVPGKPFSSDNYRSLSVSSVCSEPGLERLGIKAHSLESVAPRALRQRNERYRLSELRGSGQH
jgi:NADH dehydrogenase